jgi:hypothetical protein
MSRKPHQRTGKGLARAKHAGTRVRSWRTQVRVEQKLRLRSEFEPTLDEGLEDLDGCSCRCAHLYEPECDELCSPYGGQP